MSDDALRLERSELQRLIDALAARGYCVFGPTVRDGAIVYDELSSMRDLPEGWTDEQDAGKYRLKRRADRALFGYAVGPHSWKKYLFPPEQRLWSAARTASGFEIREEPPASTRYAFLGVRSCELHAIAIQDKVFMQGEYVDPGYARRRKDAFIVAVNCGHAAGTCFCVSMNSGPAVSSGYDLALTEVLNSGEHYFLVQSGSQRGAEVLESLSHRAASAPEINAAHEVVEETARQMGRTLDTTEINALLHRNLEHPRWTEVAARCINCANCTMACPTCFCSTVEDTTDLTGEHAERWRKWDSCFTMDFSHVHGGSVRSTGLSRYRQWMTHKLATWHDQFGTSGCVGCGRCITWCPVGIDLTEETRAIRASDGASQSPAAEK
ncbi:MAG TPA: 4Fe-4S dicluster domain-containing protein [Planctomycetota bacterium]|nr:4Fe-4S dicluster domain-containing protein [Planctomycetota bacterium]